MVHDFRRTAIRNMVRAGVSQQVAMRISGHRTASIFSRYDITDEADLKQASQRVEKYHLEKVNSQNGHSLGTADPQEAQVQPTGQPVIH